MKQVKPMSLSRQWQQYRALCNAPYCKHGRQDCMTCKTGIFAEPETKNTRTKKLASAYTHSENNI